MILKFLSFKNGCKSLSEVYLGLSFFIIFIAKFGSKLTFLQRFSITVCMLEKSDPQRLKSLKGEKHIRYIHCIKISLSKFKKPY
jgi:hypothetical protein